MIAVEHLTKRFGRNLVLDDISETIREGEKVVVIGPSGSGKTTTAMKIEEELEYPGQIKVNMIRETKVIEYAK